MVMLAVIVFVSVFVIITLLQIAGGGGGASQAKADNFSSDAKPSSAKRKTHVQIRDYQKTVLFSAVPWINHCLQKFELAPRLRLLLNQADLSWTTGSLLLMSLSCFGFSAYLTHLRTGTIVFSLLIGLLMSLAPIAFVFYKRSRRFNNFEQQLPEALDMMVSAIRAGHSFNAALSLASRECQEPICSEFRICVDEQSFGLELNVAIDNLVNRVPLQDLRIAMTAILIQKESGGNLAEVLSKTSEVIRERFRLKRQVKVHTAHGRITGWAMSFLPIVLLIVLYLMNPGMESVLWKRELGIKLLYGAAGMMVLGSVVIQKIVRIDI
jgi:tight adherence protein B